MLALLEHAVEVKELTLMDYHFFRQASSPVGDYLAATEALADIHLPQVLLDIALSQALSCCILLETPPAWSLA